METVGGPLIVAGMHRSRTSLAALVLGQLGLDLGGALVPADEHNPAGYGEDLDLLHLQQGVLTRAVGDEPGGHPDWGWVPSGRFDAHVVADHAGEARRYLTARTERAASDGRPWGWKEPRSTLLLDFWAELAPGARFLLLYRHPDDVVRSLSRLGSPVLADPDTARRIWTTYNRAVVDFAGRAGARCAVVDSEIVLRAPDRLAEIVTDRLGVRLPVHRDDRADAARRARDALVLPDLVTDRRATTAAPSSRQVTAWLVHAELDALATWTTRPLRAGAAGATGGSEPVVATGPQLVSVP